MSVNCGDCLVSDFPINPSHRQGFRVLEVYDIFDATHKHTNVYKL